MSFSTNYNEICPLARYCGDGPYGTSCAEMEGFWGRRSTSRPRVADREGAPAVSFDGQWADPGYWKSRNSSKGYGSSPAMIQTLLNRAMDDARRRGATGLPARLTVDGILGNASHAAIVWYQRYVGVTGDGIVGNNTWQRLRYA